jgi:CheY-like chemotaxis protein
MQNAGVQKSALAETLAVILGISRSHAYKKLSLDKKKQVNFTIAQTQAIEEHYGVPILEASLAALSSGVPTGENAVRQVNALFTIAGRELPCKVLIGEKVAPPDSALRYIAWLDAGRWVIGEIEATLPSGPIFRVDQLELITTAAPQKARGRIAILEDERGFADNLRDFLNASGYTATTFYDVASLFDAISRTVFDAFLLDWVIGSSTSEMIIAKIRRSPSSAAPITIMTGVLTETIDAAGIMADRYAVSVLHKPLSMKTLLASISAQLATTSSKQ